MIFHVELTVFLLSLLALILLFVVGGKKSVRFLLALLATTFILLSVITPLIIKGYDPVWVVIVASVPIASIVIYLTEGFSPLSHLSLVITLVIFLLTSVLALGAVWLAHVSGIVSDLAVTAGGQLGIDLPQLLIAGIMLGTLGILIEMVVTQVETVTEMIAVNPSADSKQVFGKSFNVGVVHMGSIINTLFLIYAGVALPVLIVFLSNRSPLYSVFGYEPVSTEIIRTLVNTIGLIIAMPAATFFAAKWLKRKKV